MQFLSQGDKLLCGNGHVVCKIIQTINAGDNITRSCFKFTKKQPPQEVNCKIQDCYCGSAWLRLGERGNCLPVNIRINKCNIAGHPKQEHK